MTEKTATHLPFAIIYFRDIQTFRIRFASQFNAVQGMTAFLKLFLDEIQFIFRQNLMMISVVMFIISICIYFV